MNLVMPMRQQNDELNSGRHCESTTTNVRALANWDDKPELLGRIDQVTTTAKTVSAHAHEIKIDKSHRVLDFDDNQGGRLGHRRCASGINWFDVVCHKCPAIAVCSAIGQRISIEREPRAVLAHSCFQERRSPANPWHD